MRLLPGVEEIWGALASSPLISASVQSFIVVVLCQTTWTSVSSGGYLPQVGRFARTTWSAVQLSVRKRLLPNLVVAHFAGFDVPISRLLYILAECIG
eukprot:scaffold5793_cov92-Skeletonema_dohrnii-CCMP3373.AAC.8